jgi:hypothetical protein
MGVGFPAGAQYTARLHAAHLSQMDKSVVTVSLRGVVGRGQQVYSARNRFDAIAMSGHTQSVAFLIFDCYNFHNHAGHNVNGFYSASV